MIFQYSVYQRKYILFIGFPYLAEVQKFACGRQHTSAEQVLGKFKFWSQWYSDIWEIVKTGEVP